MADAAPVRPPGMRPWTRFLVGLIAPFAVPFLLNVCLGGVADPWMYGVAWLAILVLGLTAGLMHRRWAFFLGALLSIGVFSALTGLP